MESKESEEHLKEEQWKLEQERLKSKLVEEDQLLPDLRYLGGVDISFIKGDDINACAALVIIDSHTDKIVYEKCKMIQLQEPYIPGFLAFREVDHLVDLLKELRQEQPQLTPHLIFVDGNGKLHYRGFGLACHLGVLTGIPTIGIGKNLLHVDGLERKSVVSDFQKQCSNVGDYIELIGDSGAVWGAAVKTNDLAINPLYVSIGHKISLKTAIDLTVKFSKYRIPEPIRHADHYSGEYLRIKMKK